MSFEVKRELVRVPKPTTKSTFYMFQEVEVYGEKKIDVREHFERKDGSIQYTKVGMTIPLSVFEDLMAGFRDVAEIMREELSQAVK